MIKKIVLVAICLAALIPAASAQDCPHFERLMQVAESYWKKGEFEQALNQLAAAREHCPGRSAEVDRKSFAFTREIALKFKEAEREKKRAESAQFKAEKSERRAQANLEKAERLIAHFNFGEEDVSWAYRDGRFAIMDLEGRLLTDFVFEAPASFNNSIALAMIGGQWVFINRNGEVLSKPYDFVIPQSDGFYFCGTTQGVYSFNYKFEFVKISYIPSELNPRDTISTFSSYQSKWKLNSRLFLAQKEDGQWIELDEFGGLIEKVTFTDIRPLYLWEKKKFLNVAKIDSLYGFIDSSGTWVKYPGFIDVGNYSEGLIGVQQKDSMWGFVDVLGNWMIDPRFTNIRHFQGGLAAVQDTDSIWGFIDTLGEWKIPQSFADVNEFSGGIAFAKKEGLWGLIDTQGKWIIPPTFADVSYFTEGFAPAKKDSLWGVIDKTGKWKVSPRFHVPPEPFLNGVSKVKYEFISVSYGLIDTCGHLILPMQYVDVYHLKSNELFVAQDTNGRYFLIGHDGQKLDSIMLNVKYWVQSFNHYFAMGDGNVGKVFFANRNSFEWSNAEHILYLDSVLIAVNIDGEWNIYSDSGEKSNELQLWDEIIFEDDGFARIQKDSLWGFIDRNGKVIVEPKFISLLFYDNVIHAQSQADSLWGFIDTTGCFLYEPQFDDWWGRDVDGWAIVAKGDKWFKIDIYDRPFTFPWLRYPMEIDDPNNYYYPEIKRIGIPINPQYGLSSYLKEGLWGVVDSVGKILIEPQFDEIERFWYGLAAVRKGSLWGYIDVAGKIVIEPQFNMISGFHYGLAPVRAGNYWGFVDTSGNIAIKPQFEYVLSFEFGIAKVKKDSLWGIIDQTGKFIVDPKFDDIYYFQHGLARFRQGELWGLIDTTGQIALEPQFDMLGKFEYGLARIQRASSLVLTDMNGQVVYQIDEHGQIAYETDEFEYCLARIRQGSLWGLIDMNGQIILKPQFDGIGEFHHGFARFQQGVLLGFIDFTGKVVVKPQYTELSEFHKGWVYTSESLPDYRWANTPEELFLYSVKELYSDTYLNFLLALAWENRYCGLIDANGKVVLPIKFDAIGDLENGYALIQQSGKLGIIDKYISLILPCDYSNIYRISLHAFLVEQKGRYGIFYAKENFLIPPFYEGFGFLGEEFEWIRAKKNNKWGWINKKGEVMIPFRYDVALPFRNGEAMVLQEPYFQFFAINKEGKMLIGD